MRFSTPFALLLLLSLPYIVWLARPHLARTRWRDRASVGVRLLIMLLLTLSLAGAQIVRAAEELAVVFLVDASDSMSAEQLASAEIYVQEAVAVMGRDDEAAVVLFGANALVERPLSGLAELAPFSSAPLRLQTDLAEAIRLGIALFPSGSARRLVVLSDGAATTGDALEAARLAAAAGITIDYVPLIPEGIAAEAMLMEVDAPSRVRQGEQFSVEVSAFSTGNTAATLRILAAGRIVSEQQVQLSRGTTRFSIPLSGPEQEFVRYTVELEPAADTYYQNNQLAAFTEIVGPPRVLLVSSDGELDDSGAPHPLEASQLQAALEATGLVVERVTPALLPASLPALSNYNTIVLTNVNAKNLSQRKMEALQSYVRDLGGGLVVAGGPQSYGMGGYFRTPLEETLPVEMQIKDQDRFPAVSIVIVIDRSGSMAMPEGGLTKIQLADEAAVRVVELLNSFDEIAVIPVDTEPDQVIGPALADDKEAIIGQIRQIGAGGGGINVRTGVAAAADVLAASQHQVKHLIVLADGADSNEQDGVPDLIAELVASGATVSMVAIGDGKDVPWLQEMAELGNGRFHLTLEAANLPQIFTQETTSIQRSYLIEERFFPALASNSPIVANIQQVPPLYGYVGTSAKVAAQVVLETPLGDPLLATWQYGLGRAVAWTSDASGRWAADWVQWPGFATFWAQAVSWSITQGRESSVETVVDYDETEARLTVDARGSSGDYLNDLEMEANIVSPAGEVTPVTLQQVAPGRYEGRFVPEREGAYLLRVTGVAGDGEGETAVAQTSGWVLEYSPEYRQFEPDLLLLETIAAQTGGRDVGDQPEQVFAHTLPTERATRPIWPWLTLIAVVLLPVDIALRRLVVTRRDLARAWAVIRKHHPEPVVDTSRREQVSRLFAAKARAAAGRSDQQDTIQTEPPGPEIPTPPTPETAPPLPQTKPRARNGPEADEPPPGSLAARLLARRRQQDEAEKRRSE
jgi:uncharacterized membrane protein